MTNTYLNTTRPRREWRAGTFLGQAVTARLEYADATTTHPSRAYYYQYDTTAHTVTTLGHEDFDAGGAVTRQEQFVGLVNSTTLAVGQNEAKTYTVKTLVPAATADRSERSTVTYEANQVISLSGGRTDSCRVKNVIESIAAGGAATQVSVETLHFVPGLGFVKSYYKPMTAGAPDRNQTYLTELVSTTGTLALAAPNADSPPTLTQCSALQTGLSLVLTASSSAEANSALRTSSAVTFNGAQAIAMERRNVVSNSRSSIDYYDPTVGYLRPVGNDTFDSTGALLFTRVARTGRPDLRSAGVTAAVNYVETYTALPPTIIPTVTSNDTFTFDGFAKV
ncbi:MAG: hypothetical protein ACJ8G7_20435, partial [Rhizobacter sp.]